MRMMRWFWRTNTRVTPSMKIWDNLLEEEILGEGGICRWFWRINYTLGMKKSTRGKGRRWGECLAIHRRRRRREKEDWWKEDREENGTGE